MSSDEHMHADLCCLLPGLSLGKSPPNPPISSLCPFIQPALLPSYLPGKKKQKKTSLHHYLTQNELVSFWLEEAKFKTYSPPSAYDIKKWWLILRKNSKIHYNLFTLLMALLVPIFPPTNI